MSTWLARVLDRCLQAFFYNYSNALRYYTPGIYEAANADWEESYYG